MKEKADKTPRNKPGPSRKNTGSTKSKPGPAEPDKNYSKGQSNYKEEEQKSQRDVFCDFAGTTSRVVQKAASILEEEIAAGIVAAKQIESKFTNVKELRTGSPEDLMQRFRNDSHEVVDILIDTISLAAKYGNKLTRHLVTVKGFEQRGSRRDTATSQIPVLEMPNPIKPGASDKVTMTLENQIHRATDKLILHCTDLVSSSGERILSKCVMFIPPSIKIGASKSEKITVVVKIPEKTSPDLYSGLIQAANANQLYAILIVRVD